MKKETMKCRKEIRLYSWELEELQKQAEKMGLSDSQYLRMLITNRPRDYPEIRQELERMNQELKRILRSMGSETVLRCWARRQIPTPI